MEICLLDLLRRTCPSSLCHPGPFLLQSGWGVALVSGHCCNSSIANGNTFTLTTSARRQNLCGQSSVIVFMQNMKEYRVLYSMPMNAIIPHGLGNCYISYLLSTLDIPFCPYLSPNTLRLFTEHDFPYHNIQCYTKHTECTSHTWNIPPPLVPQTRVS